MSLAARLSAWSTGVFIGTEARLEVGFSTAQARLANLVCGGLLEDACHEAYDTWTTGLARVGPFGAAPGVSRLVQVHIRTLAQQEDSARWAMRWQATGATGALFPALDADLKLTPAQGRHHDPGGVRALPAAARQRGRRVGPGGHEPDSPGVDPGLWPPDRDRHHVPG